MLKRMSHHARMPQGLIIKAFEVFERSIGIREGLEIGDELFDPIPLFREPTTLRNLLID